jgi:hypothetical protein
MTVRQRYGKLVSRNGLLVPSCNACPVVPAPPKSGIVTATAAGPSYPGPPWKIEDVVTAEYSFRLDPGALPTIRLDADYLLTYFRKGGSQPTAVRANCRIEIGSLQTVSFIPNTFVSLVTFTRNIFLNPIGSGGSSPTDEMAYVEIAIKSFDYSDKSIVFDRDNNGIVTTDIGSGPPSFIYEFCTVYQARITATAETEITNTNWNGKNQDTTDYSTTDLQSDASIEYDLTIIYP